MASSPEMISTSSCYRPRAPGIGHQVESWRNNYKKNEKKELDLRVRWSLTQGRSAGKEPENLTHVGLPLISRATVVCPLLPGFCHWLSLRMSSVSSEIVHVWLLNVGFIKSKQCSHRPVFIRTTRQPRVTGQGSFLLLPLTAIWLASPVILRVFLHRGEVIVLPGSA